MAGERDGAAAAGTNAASPATTSPVAPPPAASPPGPRFPASSSPPPRRRPGLLWRILIWAAIVLGAYALLGFLVVPRVIHNQLQLRLPPELGRPVSIGRIEFDPFRLVLRVHDLSVAEPAGKSEFAGFRLLMADLSWRSLYRLAPVLSAVTLDQPRLHLARDAQGRLSIQDLIDKWSAQPSEPGPTPRFSVANIVIDDGRFAFDDGKLGVRQEVAPFALRVPFVSSLPVDEEVYVEPSLHAAINGAPFELEGRSLPFSETRDSTLDVDLDGVDLTRFTGYSPLPLPVELRSAKLDTALKIVFSQPAGKTPTIAVTGNARLAALDVRQPDGTPLLAVESIAVDPVSLAWPENRYTVGRVTIASPEIAVQRKAGQARFLEPVLAALERPRERSAAPAGSGTGSSGSGSTATNANAAPAPLQWRVDEIAFTGGKLAFGDAQFDPKPLRLDAGPIDLTVRKLASDPDVAADFDLALALAGGERVQAKGSGFWQKGAFDAKGQLSNLALKNWWWIAEPQVALDVLGGTLALDARVRVAPAEGGATSVRVEEGTARLKELSLRQRWDKRSLLTLPQLDLDGVTLDLARRELALGTLATRGGQMLVRREKDDRFNLQRIAEPAAQAAGSERARPASPTKAKTPAPAPASAAAAPSPWSFTLAKLAVGDFRVDVEDERGGQAANMHLQGIDLQASGLSSAERAPPIKLSLRSRVDRGGMLAVSGEVAPSPLAGTLRVAVRRLAIAPFQPYFSEYVRATVSGGAASAQGDLRFELPPGAAPRVWWKGSAAVDDFGVRSRAANNDLLRWKSLALQAIDFASEPLKVDVGGVTLTDLYARLVLNSQGRLNLQDLLADRSAPQGEAAATPAPAPRPASAAAAPVDETMPPGAVPAPSAGAPASSKAQTVTLPPPSRPAGGTPRNLRIGGVKLVNGNVDFSDFFVKPNYSANLTGLNGQVSRITPGEAGDLELRGRIDHTGAVEILGKVNPLADPLFLDVTANASDIDLPRLSPYSGKYVGYGIEKGKLSAKVSYKVENRQLTAENNIVLDQLTFGEKVDSPDALKLPVLFAVSLLKDRNGVIDVNLPISGSLDDPQFSIAGIVLRIIGNLIVKAVTAPFSLLANLAGARGEELSWVGFAPGRSALDAPAHEKLEALAKALNDRPGLSLDISGRADGAVDGEALRKRSLERAVKAQKLKDTGGGSASNEALDQVTVAPQEYEKYLTQAYKAASFDKPRNVIGLVKSQPVAEMERMLLANARVSENALVRLANERAQQVKGWLADNGHIPAARLFIVSPKVEGTSGAAAAPAQAGGEGGAQAGKAAGESAPQPAGEEAARPSAAQAAGEAASVPGSASKSAPPTTRVDLRLK